MLGLWNEDVRVHLSKASGAMGAFFAAAMSPENRLQGFGRLLLRGRCLVCTEPAAAGGHFCRDCAEILPWNRCACRQCGLPLSLAVGLCGLCRTRPPPFARSYAPFRYAFPIDRLLPRFKFHGELAVGAALASLMASTLVAAERPQRLLPVPLHRTRLRERGYDQALELAKTLSRHLHIPLCPDVLVREQATEAQSRLDADARRRNVRNAFACLGPVSGHVALVDDVLTTGATVSECAKVLRRAGARRVDVWVLARAGRS